MQTKLIENMKINITEMGGTHKTKICVVYMKVGVLHEEELGLYNVEGLQKRQSLV